MLVKHATSLVIIISLLLAYVFSAIFSNIVQALFARQLGDDTSERAGFLEIDPFTHVDFIGLFVLMVWQFGWARRIPFNIRNIKSRYALAWGAGLYSLGAVIALILGTFSLIALVKLTGYKDPEHYSSFLKVDKSAFWSLESPHLANSSLLLGVILFLRGMVQYNFINFIVSALQNGLEYLGIVLSARGYNYTRYNDYVKFIGLLLMIPFIMVMSAFLTSVVERLVHIIL